MKRILLLFTLSAIATAAAQSTSGQTTSTPYIAGKLDGPRTAVFRTPQDSCDPNDIPDAMARAFRDSADTIHFVAPSSEMYASLGPDLDHLTHSCVLAHQSANQSDPADYNDATWLSSFYTFDGQNIAALTHTEYHGWSFTGECDSSNIGLCEYDSDTFYISKDGGYHFESFEAPNNLVAEVPFQYAVDGGPVGYSVDTNIIPFNGWYYAIATSWTWPPNCSGNQGPNRCITIGGAPLRTQNVFDPSSWRAWGGSDFSVSFADPYVGPIEHPDEHVYIPIPYLEFVYGLNLYQTANLAVATLWDGWDNELGPEGLYLTTSSDMVHWTKPTLVVTLAELNAQSPKGSWTFAYFSLIDPDAPDMSFSVVGDHPYLYFVRFNNGNSGDRVLFRQRVKLTLQR